MEESVRALVEALRQGYAIIPVYGDGIHDDTAAIQAAIDNAGSIVFPTGQYRVNRIVDGSVAHPIEDKSRLLN